MRLWLIEDNGTDQLLFKAHVAGLGGVQLDIAGCLAEIQGLPRPAELVFLDMMLPDVPLREPFQALRAVRLVNPKAEILMLSSHTPDEGEREEWLRQGADDWLEKGKVTREALQRIINTRQIVRFRNSFNHVISPRVEQLATRLERLAAGM